MKNILICDDNIYIIEMLSHILGNHYLHTCLTLQTAETIFNNYQLDIIILDNNLPDGLGSEMILELKKRKPDIHYIIMSGDKPNNINELLNDDIDFLLKPFSIDDVLTLII